MGTPTSRPFDLPSNSPYHVHAPCVDGGQRGFTPGEFSVRDKATSKLQSQDLSMRIYNIMDFPSGANTIAKELYTT